MDSDPPIVVGGGGSTIIWIRKDQNAEAIDPAGLPDLPGKPDHPNLYNCFILRNFESQSVKVHDGRPGPHTPVNHPAQGKKHYTAFE